MTDARSPGRQAGLLLPLFSCLSTRSWGIGEIGDIATVASWMRGAGLRAWQMLPIHESVGGQNSPYTVLSTASIDPIYVSVPLVSEFQDAGGEAGLGAADSDLLARVRASAAIDYLGVRTLKGRVLRMCFDRFVEQEWNRNSARADRLRAFAATHSWWLPEYALFRAIHFASGGVAWTSWEPGVRDRDARALSEARLRLSRDILFRQYLQWLAHEQWQSARLAARGMRLVGDFPFTAAEDSADVWANRDLFDLGATIGAPPDAFSKTGQNWGLPAFRWSALRGSAYEWFRGRAVRTAELFDAIRIDHVVGFFRTWVFPLDGSERHFEPAEQPAQIEQGVAVLRRISESGAQIVAEDLGTIPPVVREVIGKLGIPGYKVLRWEREWDMPGRPFRDPLDYPAASVATTGTHDTDTLAAWWAGMGDTERAALLEVPSLGGLVGDAASAPEPVLTPEIRDGMLRALFASGSDLLVLPYQDVFGWTDRINVPAVVDDLNWTTKLRWPIDTFDSQQEAADRQRALRGWSVEYRRVNGS